ncbi:ATP-dependent endonuclease [Peribacillus muralis]|uniref:ATP-dependent nuclease n=1 Tax=Peribacillus muralis TaxID=264697 RepID=UPI001F4E0D4A|nr:AAA family ATPase [Peribacillus muralis]MCK1993767.1 ATP-dependent endonuclease [Peribacillus muralis]MCK2013944.1 ATP-dependent endonuclease [Peribacillus muralis]
MRLAEIIIENYRGIGDPVRIKIDDIIVLIGNNNVGKTTILSAYEAYASSACKLSIKDFYLENKDKTPIITGIFEDVSQGELAEKWIHEDDELGYKNCIKVQYRWPIPDSTRVKYSYDPDTGEYVINGTGGFDTILSSRIPTPLKISPLDKPTEIESKILSILTEAIKSNIKKDDSNVIKLLNQIEELAKSVKEEIEEDINKSTSIIADELKKIFPELDHVEIDVKSGKLEPEKLINSGSFIRIGSKPTEEGELMHPSPLSHHGTGLQRTFLWSALKMLAETGRHKVGTKAIDSTKSKILLIEEPEAFLHPSAIKEARDALYAIADLENWQVMTTTHSPMFIDLTKNHTTIIRIEKNSRTNRTIKTFSTEEVGFTTDDRENLKMMNYCNPYINEFFFANHNLLVEGETEYSVVMSLLNDGRVDSSIHVLNCLGKGNIVTVSKILNHFSVPYSILHDSDNPTTIRQGNKIRNGAWTNNERIIEEVEIGREKGIDIKTFVSIPDFEGEFLEGVKGSSKPFEAWKYFKENNTNTERFINLLGYIIDDSVLSCPNEYKEIKQIVARVEQHIIDKDLYEHDHWDIEFFYANR